MKLMQPKTMMAAFSTAVLPAVMMGMPLSTAHAETPGDLSQYANDLTGEQMSTLLNARDAVIRDASNLQAAEGNLATAESNLQGVQSGLSGTDQLTLEGGPIEEGPVSPLGPIDNSYITGPGQVDPNIYGATDITETSADTDQSLIRSGTNQVDADAQDMANAMTTFYDAVAHYRGLLHDYGLPQPVQLPFVDRPA